MGWCFALITAACEAEAWLSAWGEPRQLGEWPVSKQQQQWNKIWVFTDSPWAGRTCRELVHKGQRYDPALTSQVWRSKVLTMRFSSETLEVSFLFLFLWRLFWAPSTPGWLHTHCSKEIILHVRTGGLWYLRTPSPPKNFTSDAPSCLSPYPPVHEPIRGFNTFQSEPQLTSWLLPEYSLISVTGPR